MRIQHNIAAMNSHRQLGMNNKAVSGNLEKLSSGFAINRAADDAAGLAISEKMRSQIKGLETATANAEDGISLVQTAEGALTEVHSMLNRMTELATKASNGTYQDADREKLQTEVVALASEIDRISSSTKFNGIELLSADGAKPIDIQVGIEATDTISVALTGMSSDDLGVSTTAVDISDSAGASAAISTIAAAIDSVSLQRSNLGATQNRLNYAVNNLGVTTENLQAAEANIRDVDMAKEMMAYTKNNILTQSAQSMLAQANQAPQGVLQLLQ